MPLSYDRQIKIGIFRLPLVFSAGLLVSALTTTPETTAAS